MAEYLPASGCLNGTTDAEIVMCICTNTVLQAEIAECVVPSCTTYDALCELPAEFCGEPFAPETNMWT